MKTENFPELKNISFYIECDRQGCIKYAPRMNKARPTQKYFKY